METHRPTPPARRAPLPLLLACALGLAACFSDKTPAADAASVDAVPDALPDAPPPDAPDDLTTVTDADDGSTGRDAGDVVDVVDAGDVNDAPPPCADDRACVDPAAPRCRVGDGRCVRCLASDDCPRGQHCDSARNTCEAGCASDTDCRRNADDAGAGPVARCNTSTGQCIECASDDECPVRTICTEGQCVPGCNERRGCSVGETCCRNACIDLNADTANCGACGVSCAAPNGVASCTMGRCAIERCTAGYADCNGSLADGCEVRLDNDPLNCGRCGTACPDVSNAAVACAAGRCGFACNAGYADCDGSGANGCERNLDADPMACGGCSSRCPTPTGAQSVLCGGGVCGFSCRPGLGNCDGDASNGCETSVQTSLLHCGACDMACPARANAAATCALGRCGFTCNAGFGDCDGDASNGCETDLASATEHCGRCGNRCSVAGGTAACVMGACTVAACGSDFADCDGVVSNGCESDLRTSAAHCGACATSCAARANTTATCEARVCGARCNAGYADCDGEASNGCEVNTQSTVTSCGACGRACTAPNGTAGCSAGSCTLATCNPGFADCDRAVANGCETDLARSVTNCGACGVRGTEVCDGRDNTCDGRSDELCPTALGGLDAISATSPSYGAGAGVAWDLSCPAGTFATGVTGRLYSGYYHSSLTLRCARPRLVESTTTTPYRYSVAWDAAGTVGPIGLTSGSVYTFDCPAGSAIHRVTPYYFSSIITQVTWECASWSVSGSTSAGWRVTRTVTHSGTFGRLLGTRADYTCPDAGTNASAMRAVFGRLNSPYLSSIAVRCASSSITVR